MSTNEEKMAALLGDPFKIKLGEKEYNLEKLTMRRQIEVFNLVAKHFTDEQGSMFERLAAGAQDAVASVLGVEKDKLEGTAAELMTAMLKIWEVNNFDPLYQAVATLNKKILRQ